MDKGKHISFTVNSAEIFLLAEGNIELTDGSKTISLQPGNPAGIAFAGQKVELSAIERSIVFKATAAVHNRE